jgi:general secretion pathway protein E
MPDAQLQCRLPIAESFAAEYLEYYRLLPLEVTEQGLRVAIAGEPQEEALDDLRTSYGASLELIPVTDEELQTAIRQTFAAAESVVELVRDLSADASPESGRADDAPTDVRDLANQPPVIRFVNLLIREAHAATASDIHLEATREGLRIRLRVDGVLAELPSPPTGLQAAVVSRIKLLAEPDIAERRRAQDGRIRVRLESRELDLRVATVPTLYGESVVLRLLDRGGRPVGLDELGMDPASDAAFRCLVQKPHGILLATGPTGSGRGI